MQPKPLHATFTNSIAAPLDAAPIIPHIASETPQARERFAVYQNNVHLTQIEALGETFNTVAALVGEEFFSALAAAHAEKHPPQSMNLNDYGDEFPAFIASFPHTQSLPYLADVARFDAAWHQSFFAMNEPLLSLEEISAIDFTAAETLTLRAASHMKPLMLEYPAHALWRYCVQTAKGEAAEEPNIVKREYPILIWREGLKVNYAVESVASYHAYFALSQGKTLETIISSAMAIDPKFPVSEWLQTLFSRAILIHS